MPDLAPFRAVSYTDQAGEPAELLAPPYDVIDAEEARALRARSPFNAVHLVLPEGGEPGRYELAGRRLRAWLEDGVLRRDRRPFLYVYRQTFRREGTEHTRSGILGAVPVSPFSRGEVLPHEETHREPKEDRLALMRACRAQLSPVFLVAGDRGRRLPALVDRATRGAPVREGTTPDGIRHRLWRVTEGPVTDGIRQVVAGRPLLIADGHHRYETALAMARNAPPGSPSHHTLACVVSGEDPGLLCLPTHRALAHLPEAGGPDGWRELLEHRFRVTELPVAAGAEGAARAAAETESPGEMVALIGGSGTLLRLRPADGDRAPAPVVFDRDLLRPAFGTGPDGAVESGILEYHRDAEAAGAAAGERGAAFLLPPPDFAAIWESALQGGRLPPKSTYFWPKLPSGLLFRLLDG